MRKISIEDAVGVALCHDITRIIPGKEKGVAFKRGHIITEQDIPALLDIGKKHFFIWSDDEGLVHEDDAALRISNAAKRSGIKLSKPSEGKINFTAQTDGLLIINVEQLFKVNDITEIVFATIHSNTLVKKGQIIAGCRVVPLAITDEKVKMVEQICGETSGIIEIVPTKKMKVGLVTTGSEIFHKRIEDRFGPVVAEKMHKIGSQLVEQIFVDDNIEDIKNAILDFKNKGMDLILTSGGMSVDPDDLTPVGIRESGAEIVSYGAPVLPGAMCLVAYLDSTPVIGLPGCVMYAKVSIFDLLLPKIMAGIRINRSDIVRLGHGGLCMSCKECIYPRCSFGR